MDLPGVAVFDKDIDLDEDTFESKRRLVDDLLTSIDKLPGLCYLLSNRQAIKRYFGTTGESC